MTQKAKRVKQPESGPRKKKKPILLTIHELDDEQSEEEETQVKVVEKVSIPLPSIGKSKPSWKPQIGKLNITIANNGNFA